MKLGRIELRHTFLGETGFVIIRIFKTSAPLTQASFMVNGVTVNEVVYPAPHTEQSLLIEDIDPVMYDVKSYRSAGGVTPDSQIFTLACDGGARAAYQSTTFTYVVDRGESGTDPNWSDPASGQRELRDERLLDGEYAVFKRGIGQLVPPTETTPEYEDRSDAGGGFDLIDPYGEFEPGDTYFVTLQNRVDVIDGGGSGSGSGEEVSDVFIIDEDQDFDPVEMNQKLLFVDYPGAVIGVLTFPNFSLIPDCSFKLTTHGGLQTFLQLQLDSGDTVRFMGEDKNVITLGVSEEISIMIRNNVMYILSSDTGYKKLGQRIWGDKLEQNTLYRDGSEYDQADQPRIMEFIDSLPGSQVLSYGAWASDKGKFARDDVAGTFKVPDDRNMFIRSLNNVIGTSDPERTTQGAGGKQSNANKPHGHAIGTSNGSPSGNNNADPVRATTAGSVASVQGVEWTAGADTLTIRKSGGIESRPDNVGLLPLICI